MGNLKISKAKKKKNARGSSGIPNWLLSTLVIIVVVAVLATCIGTFVASSGLAMRMSTAMTLDDYKVDGNMMAYFYKTTYMNFLNNNSSYLSYLSLDQSKDLKLQEFNPEGSYDAYFVQAGSDVETWHDYFVQESTASVKNLLVYCAEANKLGITLTDEDKLEIEASIESLLIDIRTSLGGGYPEYVASLSDNTCLADIYGNGVTKKDIRNAMELSYLASKAAERISDDIEGAITDDRINSTYESEKLDFDLVDYFNYSITVYYDDVISELYGDEIKAEDLDKEENADKKAAVLALYTEKIVAAHEAAEGLKGKTTLDDFRNWVIDYETKTSYDEQFKTAMKDVADDKKPAKTEGATEEPLDVIKNKTIEAVIKEVIDGKKEVTDDVVTTEADSAKTYTLYDISITEEFAKAAKTLKSKLFDLALSARNDNLAKRVNYTDDDLGKWLFNADRKANETANFESGDGCNSSAVKVSKESFTADVTFLVKPVYRDETLSRNLAYMLFTKEENAKKAIEALEATEGLDKDKFLAIATDENNPADAYSTLDDYIVGTMQSDEFDEWLFAATKENEYTKTPITMSDSSLMVAMYLSEGDMPAWKYTVKAHIYNEDYAAYEERMNSDFASSVVVNTKVINKVGA